MVEASTNDGIKTQLLDEGFSQPGSPFTNYPMKKDKVDEAGTLYGETLLLEEPCDYEPTQLCGETEVLDDPVDPGLTEVLEEPVDTEIETQLIEDMGDWIETQVVDEKGEEVVEEKIGSEKGLLCEADCGTRSCGEREERECLVDSDASTDDESCGSGIIKRRLSSVRVASVRSCALAATRNLASKSSDNNILNGTSKSANFLSKITRIDSPSLVREKKVDPDKPKKKMVRQLFADVALETERVDPVSFLSYVEESQEPGILSQENALDIVDKLIASHDVGPTGEEGRNVIFFNNTEMGRASSAQAGTVQLAKSKGSASLEKKAGIFDWDDVRDNGTGGDLFAKKKDLFFKKKKKSRSHPPKKSRERKKKARDSSLSDSRLVLERSCKVSYESIRKNLFNERENEGRVLERENEGAVHMMDNVGPDTQIAVEAIQALVHGSPGRPGSSEGKEREESERERISDDGRNNEPIGSTKGEKESTEEVIRTRGGKKLIAEEGKSVNNAKKRKVSEKNQSRGRKKLIPDEGKSVNNAKKRKVSEKNQSEIPEKVGGDFEKTGLDIFSNSTPVPRRTRSSKGSDLFNERENEGRVLERENEGAVHMMGNVGPDTQIAVEAIQALVHGSPGRPGSSEGREREEIELERISDDGRNNEHIASDKGVNNVKRRKVAEKNQSEVPEKVGGDIEKTGLDIFSNLTPIPRRTRTPVKNSGRDAKLRKKRVFIKSATELLDKAKRQRRLSLSEIGKESPVFTPIKSQKKVLTGGSYRPSVQKELLRLETGGSSSVIRKWKDLRVRRDLADARVLLSHHLDEKVIKQQRKILERLQIPEASSMSDGTHFVADQFVRTRNLLEAMARGKPIVTPDWLERCNLTNRFVDEKHFILRDARKEKEIRFSMPNSLATACLCPLLKGKRVLITPSVKPSLQVVRNFVIACGGTPMERIVSSLIRRKGHDDLLLVSCEEDYQTCRPLLEKGVGAYSSELILNGIVIQKLELERHQLFSDCVKRTRSTIWLRDEEGGKFLPATK